MIKAIIIVDALNMRSDTNLSADIVGIHQRGAEIIVSDEETVSGEYTWRRVYSKMSGRELGWVAARRVVAPLWKYIELRDKVEIDSDGRLIIRVNASESDFERIEIGEDSKNDEDGAEKKPEIYVVMLCDKDYKWLMSYDSATVKVIYGG